MNTRDEEHVLQLVRTGKISREEGQRLIQALRGRSPSWPLLFDPFNRLSTPVLWGLAVAAVAASSLVARLGIRFDGALDVHRVAGTPSFTLAMLDNANAILVTGVLMWIVSRLVSGHGRLIDFVVFVAVARIPLVITGGLLAVLLPPPGELLERLSENPADLGADLGLVLLVTALALPGVVWFFTLLFQAFKVSSGLKGARLGISFAGALLAAEILSKGVLVAIARM